MNRLYFLGTLAIALALLGCSKSSSNADQITEFPISLSIQNEEFTAGVPKGFSYAIPAPTEPYTDVTIDIAKTLESAQISVNPAP